MPKVAPKYKEIAKENIIQAAIKIFSQKGYHAATMDEIAKEIGVSKTALYTYFKSKEDILKAIKISSNNNIKEFKKSLEGRECEEVLEELYSLMLESQDLHLSFETAALSARNEDIKKLNKESYEAKLDALKTFIRDQQNKGKIRDDLDASVLAQMLTAFNNDVATQLLIGIDKEKIHEIWKKSIAAILRKNGA